MNSQGTPFTVEIYGNNTALTINYTYVSSHSVASNTFDLWVNGILVGDDLSKSQLPDDSNIDSFMFYGGGSTSNAATIYIDDIFYTNEISSNVLPVCLSSFTADLSGNKVILRWRTETEINNYGFEIERKHFQIKSRGVDEEWRKIGFVDGGGNRSSPQEYSFTDELIFSHGKYLYRLRQIDMNGTLKYSKELEVYFELPRELSLKQNFPNPFNPSTEIYFSIPEPGYTQLTVYNVAGEKVATLLNQLIPSGTYQITFDAAGISSGIYFYFLKSGNFLSVKKMMVMR